MSYCTPAQCVTFVHGKSRTHCPGCGAPYVNTITPEAAASVLGVKAQDDYPRAPPSTQPAMAPQEIVVWWRAACIDADGTRHADSWQSSQQTNSDAAGVPILYRRAIAQEGALDGTTTLLAAAEERGYRRATEDVASLLDAAIEEVGCAGHVCIEDALDDFRAKLLDGNHIGAAARGKASIPPPPEKPR